MSAPKPPTAKFSFHDEVKEAIEGLKEKIAKAKVVAVYRRTPEPEIAVCKRCKTPNEYADPSPDYCCYSCRNGG